MACVPPNEIRIHRIGILSIVENAHILSDSLHPIDAKITVKQVVDWICTCPNETLDVTVSNNFTCPEPVSDTVIWSKEAGFYMNPTGIFYEEMENHRQGNAAPSERIGTYVLVSKIKE